MMAHRVRIMQNKTFRLNPTVCKPYNADFDGDEMNLHVPQTEEGKAEAEELMFVEKQIISPRYGGPVIILDEDAVSGTYILTMNQTEFDKEEAMYICHEFGFNELPKPDKGKKWSGKSLFSLLLPKDLNLSYPTKTMRLIKKTGISKNVSKENDPYDSYLVIKGGVLEKGVVDSASLGEARGILVDTLAK